MFADVTWGIRAASFPSTQRPKDSPMSALMSIAIEFFMLWSCFQSRQYRWPMVGPRLGPLERRSGSEHACLVPPSSYDLKADRQHVLGESAGDGNDGQRGERDRIGEIEPFHVVRHFCAGDLRRIRELDGERQRGRPRQDHKIVVLHEAVHTLPEPRARQFRPGDLARCQQEPLLDVPYEPLLQLGSPAFKLVRMQGHHAQAARAHNDLMQLVEIRRCASTVAPRLRKTSQAFDAMSMISE